MQRLRPAGGRRPAPEKTRGTRAWRSPAGAARSEPAGRGRAGGSKWGGARADRHVSTAWLAGVCERMRAGVVSKGRRERRASVACPRRRLTFSCWTSSELTAEEPEDGRASADSRASMRASSDIDLRCNSCADDETRRPCSLAATLVRQTLQRCCAYDTPLQLPKVSHSHAPRSVSSAQ